MARLIHNLDKDMGIDFDKKLKLTLFLGVAIVLELIAATIELYVLGR